MQVETLIGKLMSSVTFHLLTCKHGLYVLRCGTGVKIKWQAKQLSIFIDNKELKVFIEFPLLFCMLMRKWVVKGKGRFLCS